MAESQKPSVTMIPRAGGNSQYRLLGPHRNGSARANDSRAHVKSNILGSRWVAAERTAGESMNTAAATMPAKTDIGSRCCCTCSPRTRQPMNVATRQNMTATAIAPQIGASTLPAPKSVANTAISGYGGCFGTSIPCQHAISEALSPGKA